MEQQSQLNTHNKEEYPPMHTAEHILNSRMVRYFGCGRAFSSHIEKKKSKCDYRMEEQLSENDIAEIERQVNEIIEQHIDIEDIICNIKDVPASVDLSKLPDPAVSTLRLIKIGGYDLCACIGTHVRNTSEIGRFKIISHNFEDGKLRIRFKLE